MSKRPRVSEYPYEQLSAMREALAFHQAWDDLRVAWARAVNCNDPRVAAWAKSAAPFLFANGDGTHGDGLVFRVPAELLSGGAA